MRSPALALTWQVWWRQRWFWAATGTYVLVLAVVCQVVPAGDGAYVTALVGLVPLGYVTIFGLGFLSLLATNTDLSATSSGFPSWMFTLPVRTRALTGWVMLNGTGALLAGWLVVAYVILRPCGIHAPWWLALLGPALLAWMQVLAWAPFAFPLVRLSLMVAILTGIGAVPPLLVLLWEVPPAVVFGLEAGLIAGAYLLGMHGVARARRGDGLEARWLPRQMAQFADWLPRRRRAFASAEGAQLWYEWRRNGLVLPLMVGFLLVVFMPFFLARAPWQPDEGPGPGPFLIACCLLLPPGMAMFVGSAMGKGDSRTNNLAFPPFLAARPMTTTAFVTVKLRMTARSALATCALGLLAALACLAAGGNAEVLSGWWDEWLRHYPRHQAWMLLILSPVALFLLTWKNLAEGMWVGLTGRTWVAVVLGLSWIAVFLLLGLGGAGLYHYPEYREYLRIALPAVAGLALLAKAAAAVWVVRALHRRRLLASRSLARAGVLWLVAVGGLFGVAWWLLPAGVVSTTWLAVGCVYSVPFAQLAVAPLALEWNRHR